MGQRITVQIKSVYGEEKVYPACPVSVIFARMVGTKTLTPETLRHIRALGYEIAVEQPRVMVAA